MTTTLANKTCTPCRGGAPPLKREEAEALRANAKDWEVLDDAHRIERENFLEAMCFVEGVDELAGSTSPIARFVTIFLVRCRGTSAEWKRRLNIVM